MLSRRRETDVIQTRTSKDAQLENRAPFWKEV